jgi:pilus biogenesis lipoprotein CpaD
MLDQITFFWRSLRIAAACIGMLVVSGCFSDEPNVYEVEDRHPIRVKSEVVSLPVSVNRGEPDLPYHDIQKLDALLSDFIRRGGGVLEIGVAGHMKDNIAVLARVGQVRQHAMRRGIQASEIRINRNRSAGKDFIVVSYERFTADPVVCGHGNIGAMSNPLNRTHPNFGCITQANTAAMVSNPADLVRSREQQAPDTNASNNVVRSYRTSGKGK